MSTISSENTESADSTAYHLLEPLDLKRPFWKYFELFGSADYAFLLDSALRAGRLGQYSFVGGDPSLIFRAKRRRGADADIELTSLGAAAEPRGAEVVHETGDPLARLRSLMDDHAVPRDGYAATPVPLLSGAVGYFGYEAAHFIERLPDSGSDELQLPDIYFMFFDSLLCHCHASGQSYLSVVGRGATLQRARRAAEQRRDVVLQRIEQFHERPLEAWSGPSRPGRPEDIEVRAGFDETGYCDAVRAIKARIREGDIYQACMTQQFQSQLTGSAWDLYCELRRINPAPFSAFFKLPDAHIVSASPERFLSLDRGGVCESRPIKGTRPRGINPESDAAQHLDLSTSEKDIAENVMIVDLVRNDFGRVCRFGTVQVPDLMAIERYATVFQMVSTIRGELADGYDALDLIRACFPGGSMTGAPKIEAMKIIDRLEPVKRGIYSGSLGYLDFAGGLDLSIVIRTIIVKDGCCYFSTGGAIVADSSPREEYVEMQTKAMAIKQALANLEVLKREKRAN